jgi:hypothetical protein
MYPPTNQDRKVPESRPFNIPPTFGVTEASEIA